MSHKVETMAYTNEVPWHGLGKHVDGNQSVKSMLKAAGLDWRVDRQPMFLEGQKKPIDGFAALVRDKDGAVFDVVGSQYTPVQNEQAFEFFNEFVQAGKAKMETAGSLRGGRYVWGLANLNTSFKLKGDDVVKGYLLCACPHQQGKSMVFKFTTVRVVCNNTLTLALGTRSGSKTDSIAEYRRSHRSEFDAGAVEAAKVALGIARDQLGEFEVTARRLQAKRMKRDTIIEVLQPIFAPKVELKSLYADFEKAATPSLTAIMNALTLAPGAQPDNAWGALNAVTYYADHIASRTADKRLTNAWLGKTGVQKEKVLEALLAA